MCGGRTDLGQQYQLLDLVDVFVFSVAASAYSLQTRFRQNHS